MQTILDRIYQLLSLYQLNQTSLAKIMGISPGAVNQFMSEKTKPSVDSLSNLLIKYPELSSDWLILGIGTIYKSSSSNVINLPIVGQISAGEPLSIPDIEPLKFVTLDRTAIPTPDHLTCFQVSGDSMLPLIQHQDIIIISHIFDFHSLNNSICVIQIDGANTLKQIILNPTAKQTILMPLNSRIHHPIILDYDTPGNITILGKLVRLIRNF